MLEEPNTKPTDAVRPAAASDVSRVDPADKRSAAGRKLNEQIRHIIELESHDGDYHCNFFCECGCYEPAPLTIGEYDALHGKTLYREGHAPLEKRFSVVIHPSHKPAA